MGDRSTSHPGGTLPPEVQFVLNWNPPEMTARRPTDANLTQEPNAVRATAIGYTRPAAFYDKHLASHLILKRVICLDTLVSTIASIVDHAVTKCPLPKYPGLLLSPERIGAQVDWDEWAPYHESGVAELYTTHTSTFCRPIASTLAIHPSSEMWGAALVWTVDQKEGRWAIADGVLRISTKVFENGPLLQYEDAGMKAMIEQLASHGTALAIWEMKNLTVDTPEVMKKLVEMGKIHVNFPWRKCIAPGCTHLRWKDMEESGKDYDAGVDARSPPWALPNVPSTSIADSQLTALREGFRNTSAQGGKSTRPSYKEMSSSSVEDGEGFRKKRRRNDSNSSEHERPPPKKSNAGLMDEQDESYEPPPGARKEATAESFLQQTWAEVVRNRCTIMVMHSGNNEVIGIRHRKTQTLYISDLIESYSCSNPAYGKIQVGIYIAAIQETMDRARQDMEARSDPSADVSPRKEEANDLGGYSPERTTVNKPSRGASGKGTRQGRHEGNAKRHASGKVIDDQALLANAARQNSLCLRFFYDIYDSPHPAAFRRLVNGPKKAAGSAEPQTDPLSPGHETMPQSVSAIHITVQSELQAGSTGIVHIGTMAVDRSGPTTKVAVKVAFSRDEKSRLIEEHRIYSHLKSKGVQGIPQDIGLFVDEEPLLDAEGPYALVLSYAGVSLFGHSEHASDSVKDSLLKTLTSIHKADILHGDIGLPNLCVTASGEAFIVDFSHATENSCRKEKAHEIKDLAYILGMDLLTGPAAKDVEKPVVTYSDVVRESKS